MQIRKANADSADHAVVDSFRRARSDSSIVILEGFHPLKHAIRFSATIHDSFAFDIEGLLALAKDLAPDTLEWIQRFVKPISKAGFDNLATTPPETGVISLAERPAFDLGKILAASAPLILLENPAHLGNIGAVIRVAAAAGAAAVLTTGVHDPWNPGVIRGSAGLHYAIGVEHVSDIPATTRPIIAIHPEGTPLTIGAIPQNALLVFGSERHGLARRTLERATQVFAIPMSSGVSSLNLATAVAVVLYAWKLSPNPST